MYVSIYTLPKVGSLLAGSISLNNIFALLLQKLVPIAPQPPGQDLAPMGRPMFTLKTPIEANTVYHGIPRDDLQGSASCVISRFEFAQTPTYISSGLIIRAIIGTTILVNFTKHDELLEVHREPKIDGWHDPMGHVEKTFGPIWESTLNRKLGNFEFDVLDKVMAHQFDHQGQNVFRTETVLDCHLKTGYESDTNAIIQKLSESGWQKLEGTLKAHYERERENIIQACIPSTQLSAP